MRMPAILIVGTAMVIAGCSASMSPGARIRNEMFWEAATQCENRYRTLHLEQIDIGGGITLRADAESRSELQAFKACYRQAVNDRVEQRRRAGLPIPEELTVEPTVEVD